MSTSSARAARCLPAALALVVCLAAPAAAADRPLPAPPDTAAGWDAFRQAMDEASNAAYRAGDMARTGEVERRVLEQARRFGDRREEALSIHALAMVDTASGRLDEAERGYAAALAVWDETGDDKGRALSLRGLGRVHEARGRLIDATEAMVAALELLLRHGTPMDQSESYYSLARLFTNLEDHEAARHAVDRAIELMGEAPPDFPLALNLATRSAALRELGDPEAALADAEAALAAAVRADSPPGKAIARIALGYALGATGQPGRALDELREGQRIATGISEPVMRSDLLLAEGVVLVDQGRFEQALAPLGEALDIADRLSLDSLRRNANIQLEKAHSGLGDSAAALAASRAALQAQQRIAELRRIGQLAGRDAETRLSTLSGRLLALEAASAAPDAAPAAPQSSRWQAALLLAAAAVLLLALHHALRLRRRQRELETSHAQLQDRSVRLQQQIGHDQLTGVSSRRAFHEALSSLLRNARGRGLPVSLMVLDLDHFKQINDRHGHMTGDAALRSLVGLVREQLDSEDLFGRFGGDEFMVATVRGLDEALALAERIRTAVEARSRAPGFDLPPLSVSVGVAQASADPGHDSDALFLRADAALYAAKDAGRNRVVAADDALPAIVMPRSLLQGPGADPA